MAVDVEKVITDKAEHTEKTFRALLAKTNKEPNPKDVKALSDVLGDNRKLELWRGCRQCRSSGGAVSYRKRSTDGSDEGMLETSPPSVEKGSRVTTTRHSGETFNPASSFVLAET
jgi:hypothetical protein